MNSLPFAWSVIATHIKSLQAEVQPLRSAHRRCLAEAAHVRFDLPGFDNSAMDGYAVRYADIMSASSSAWAVCGESRAGGELPPSLPKGQVMRIFTGAPLPEGADTVVIQEDTEVVAGASDASPAKVRFTEVPVQRGQHVRAKGSDMRVGSAALNAGQVLRAGELALLASQGYAQVSVYKQPRVAILCTGDELCDVEEAGQPGRVVNSNAYALAAQIEEAGGVPWVLAPAADRKEAVIERIQEAMTQDAQGADMLLTVGGVSVGDYDVVWPALDELGAQRHFWKVAIKPGKPVMFGEINARPLFGLPGNPISAMVTFELFVRPAIRMLQGDPNPYRAALRTRLGSARKHGHSRMEVLRARMSHDAEGLRVDPVAHQGSGSLPSMIHVDALVFLPPGPEVYDAGSMVLALPLHTAASADPPLR